ncbi:MAG: hypothetical protein RL414_1249 [Actinomycetota bacterium]
MKRLKSTISILGLFLGLVSAQPSRAMVEISPALTGTVTSSNDGDFSRQVRLEVSFPQTSQVTDWLNNQTYGNDTLEINVFSKYKINFFNSISFKPKSGKDFACSSINSTDKCYLPDSVKPLNGTFTLDLILDLTKINSADLTDGTPATVTYTHYWYPNPQFKGGTINSDASTISMPQTSSLIKTINLNIPSFSKIQAEKQRISDAAIAAEQAARDKITNCPKAGTTKTQNGVRFTCLLQNGKLGWGVPVTVNNLSTAKVNFTCSATTEGKLSTDKKSICGMISDDPKYFALLIFKSKPEADLCRNDSQYWSNQFWYDGYWKCGYFVSGGWSNWGWHSGASQYPTAYKQTHTLAAYKSKIPVAPASTTPNCTTDSRNVRASVGADNSQGANLTALVFQNLSNCNLSVSATAGFICPDGSALKLQNSIRSTGFFALKPKQTLYVSYNVTSVFTLATQQCAFLTGYRTNMVVIDHFRQNPINVSVLTAMP